MARKRVLSGMRPTGPLHMGHLLGALNNWLDMQEKYDCFFMVADWHALTTEYENPANIKEYIHELMLDFLSVGIDPEKAVMFVQSDVKEHAELALLLGMNTPTSWLERVPTYKEQRQQLKEKNLATYGFLGYPLLQAADIIIYQGDYVPVGEDQLPHIELTREVVRRFNYLYKKEYFVEPQGLLSKTPKLLGVDGRKMSKSYNNGIYLKDSAKEIKRKINMMITDPARVRLEDKGHPEVCHVFEYHNVFQKEITEEIAEGCRAAAFGCSKCKGRLFDKIWSLLEPIQKRRSELEQNPDYIAEVRKKGMEKAQAVASKTIQDVHKLMGLI